MKGKMIFFFILLGILITISLNFFLNANDTSHIARKEETISNNLLADNLKKLSFNINQSIILGETISETEITEKYDTIELYYLEEEDVRQNITFSQFLNGQVAAYDIEENIEISYRDFIKKVYEEQFENIVGINVITEDINADAKEELLIIWMTHKDQGDLYVFYDDNGQIYLGQVFSDFFHMRMSEINLRENGFFEFIGGHDQGYYFMHYNDSFEWEKDMHIFEEFITESDEITTRYKCTLIEYENGTVVNELQCIQLYQEGKEDESCQYILGDESILEQINEKILAYTEQNPIIRKFGLFYIEEGEVITLEQLLRVGYEN